MSGLLGILFSQFNTAVGSERSTMISRIESRLLIMRGAVEYSDLYRDVNADKLIIECEQALQQIGENVVLEDYRKRLLRLIDELKREPEHV